MAKKRSSKKKSPARSKRNAAIRALKAGGNKATSANINNYLRANAKKGGKKGGKKGKKRGPTKFQRFLLNSPEQAKKKMGW